MDKRFLTPEEAELVDYAGEEEILAWLFAKPNGCSPWRKCQHSPACEVHADGTVVSLACEREAMHEYLLEQSDTKLQLWLCTEHYTTLCNTIGLATHIKAA